MVVHFPREDGFGYQVYQSRLSMSSAISNAPICWSYGTTTEGGCHGLDRLPAGRSRSGKGQRGSHPQRARVQADSIVENYEGGSPVDEISEKFAIPESTIRGVLNFAANKRKPF